MVVQPKLLLRIPTPSLLCNQYNTRDISHRGAVVVHSVECLPGYRKVGGSTPGLEIFSFFLHNEVRDGGRGAQRPLFGLLKPNKTGARSAARKSGGCEFKSWAGNFFFLFAH